MITDVPDDVGIQADTSATFVTSDDKVSKGAKIMNPYNQVPHLNQDTNKKK